MAGFYAQQFPVAVLEVLGLSPGQTPLTSVAHDATLTGAGTVASPLSVVSGSGASTLSPSARANGMAFQTSGGGGSFTPTYGADVKSTDIVFYVVGAGSANAVSINGDGVSCVGPIRKGGASEWYTMFVSLATGTRPTSVTGTSLNSILTVAFVPQAGSSTNHFDLAGSDNAPSINGGVFSTNLGFTNTAHPATIFNFVSFSPASGLGQPLAPPYGGAVPGLTAKFPQWFTPWGCFIGFGWAAFVAYVTDALPLGSPLSYPWCGSNSTSGDCVILYADIYAT